MLIELMSTLPNEPVEFNELLNSVPVNLIFGEIFSGSVIVSAGIDTVQVKGTA